MDVHRLLKPRAAFKESGDVYVRLGAAIEPGLDQVIDVFIRRMAQGSGVAAMQRALRAALAPGAVARAG